MKIDLLLQNKYFFLSKNINEMQNKFYQDFGKIFLHDIYLHFVHVLLFCLSPLSCILIIFMALLNILRLSLVFCYLLYIEAEFMQ